MMAMATRKAKKQVYHAVVYIALSSLYNETLPNFMFYEGHEPKVILFFFSYT